MSTTDNKTVNNDLPAWKADFLSKPSISIRKAIADNFGPPYEDTSTLVLTVPSNRFVDIRFPKTLVRDDSGHIKPLLAQPSFWAFSGSSSTTFYDAEDGQPGLEFTAHTVFTHDIDSKGRGILDEGDCFLLPNGDAMEVGIWSHNGQMYKEVWTSPDPLPGLQMVDKFPVIVADTVGELSLGKGIIVRIGHYIQGLFEYKDVPDGREKVLVRRITKMETGWIDDHRNNYCSQDDNNRENSLLPCERLTEDCYLGLNWTAAGVKWQVTEYHTQS